MNNYSSSTAAADAIMGLFGAATVLILIISIIVALILCVFIVICNWKILVKAGEEGWKAIIPFYNYFVFCNVSMTKPTYLVVFFVFLGGALLSFVGCIPYIGFVFAGFAGLIMAVANGFLNFSLAKSFGKDVAICVLAIFFPPIVRAILAFSGSEYTGDKVSVIPES